MLNLFSYVCTRKIYYTRNSMLSTVKKQKGVNYIVVLLGNGEIMLQAVGKAKMAL